MGAGVSRPAVNAADHPPYPLTAPIAGVWSRATTRASSHTGAAYDTASATHDRGHAGSESRQAAQERCGPDPFGERLNGVAAGMAPLFEALGAPLRERVRMAIGFTSAGRRSRAIGECWDNRRSADGHFEIFIRPDLAHAPDAMSAQIAAILAHELVHAAVGIKTGHGKSFTLIVLGLVLVGPMRTTTPGEAFLAAVAPILAAAGPLPHARLDTGGLTTAPRKQADAQVRVSGVRLHRQDLAQIAGDGRDAALPDPGPWRDVPPTARRGRRLARCRSGDRSMQCNGL